MDFVSTVITSLGLSLLEAIMLIGAGFSLSIGFCLGKAFLGTYFPKLFQV